MEHTEMHTEVLSEKLNRRDHFRNHGFFWEDHVKEEGYESGRDLSGTGLGLVTGYFKQHKEP